MNCEHEQFEADVAVKRMEDTHPMAFVAEIPISCVQCGERFRFKGVPAGMGFHRPLVDIDGCKLNAPIEPEGQTRLMQSAVIEMLPRKGEDA